MHGRHGPPCPHRKHRKGGLEAEGPNGLPKVEAPGRPGRRDLSRPLGAGICAAKDYKWSSYGAYVGKAKALAFVTTDFALGLLGGAKEFAAFHKAGGRFATPFPGSALHRHLSSDELVQIAGELIGREALVTIKRMKPRERAGLLAKLADAGFTDGEIGRVTGLGKSSLHRELH